MTLISYNSEEFENKILIAPTGFREYDARWLYPEQINLKGMQELGRAIAHTIHEDKLSPRIVVGHDYRSYSATLKNALIIGLMQGGLEVHDIGLALSPCAYFAQFYLDCPSVAMVTASHNENGWTGVKMGTNRPLTFGPEQMARLKTIVLNQEAQNRAGGQYQYYENFKEVYIADFLSKFSVQKKIKAVVACGNGTAGAFAPDILRRAGIEVIERHCHLDFTFPNYNPNPEDMEMLHDLSDMVKKTGADIGFGFDGDGDRCGVVDHTGHEIFADKMGVILARFMAQQTKDALFVADVKSTGLFMSDPELRKAQAQTIYWKTGHSYMKRHVHETKALAGFEKSGHFFFNEPYGRGYDDGVLTALVICKMLETTQKSLHDLYQSLPQTWSSPTMAPYCADERKYQLVEQLCAQFEKLKTDQKSVAGAPIENILTVNGVRFSFADGSWGLIRASSNKPSLVVVVESTQSENHMTEIFKAIDAILKTYPEVGDYDQVLKVA
jgi:phosphomannomutase / phosphoglucomutase